MMLIYSLLGKRYIQLSRSKAPPVFSIFQDVFPVLCVRQGVNLDNQATERVVDMSSLLHMINMLTFTTIVIVTKECRIDIL